MDEKDNNCPICFESLKDKKTAYIDVCDHVFCFSCLNKWLKIENYCPIDRKKIRQILSSGEIIKVKSRKRKRSKTLYDVSVYCEICNDSKQNDTVILCDSCDLAFHMVCLEPPLKSVPAGHWYCSVCKDVEKRLKKKESIKTKDTLEGSKTNTLSTSFVGTRKEVEQINSKIDTNKQKNAENLRDTKKCLSLRTEESYNRKKNNSFVLKTKHASNYNTEVSSDSEDFFNMHGDDIILTTKQKFWNKQNNFSSNKNVNKRKKNSINENSTSEKIKDCFNIQDDKVTIKNEKSNGVMENSSIIESILKGRILRSCRKRNRRSQRLAAGKVLTVGISSKKEYCMFSNMEKALLPCSSDQNSSLVNLQKDEASHENEHPSFEPLHEILETSPSDTEHSDKSKQLSVLKKLNTSISNEKYSNLNETGINFNLKKFFGIPNSNLEGLENHEVCKLSSNNTSDVIVNQDMNLIENSLDVLQSPVEAGSSSDEYSMNLERRNSSTCDSNEIEENDAFLQFSVFEKLDDTSVANRKYLDLNKVIGNHNQLKSLTENLGALSCNKMTRKNSISSVKQASSHEVLYDLTKNFQENPLDNINIREAHYAMKAKKNLPAELRKIEEEKWKLRHVKSKKNECHSLSSKNGINVSFHSDSSISNNAIFTEKKRQGKMDNDDKDIIDIFSSNIIKSYFEPGYVNKNYFERVDDFCPKKFFELTEYNLMHSKEKIAYNNNPKDILCDIFPSDSLKHLEVRPDGSLFINWVKSSS